MAITKLSESQILRITGSQNDIFEIVPGKKIRLGIILELVDKAIDYSIDLHAVTQNCEVEVRIVSLLTSSKLTLSGTLIVEKGAKLSNLYLSHHTILLDTLSFVYTQPRLVLSETDIKCGHGATVSNLAESQLEYLQTRGIARQNAKTMLCCGKVNQLCEWVLMKSDAVH